MLRSVVKGLAEAKRRQREVEDRRDGRAVDTNDRDAQEIEEKEEEEVREDEPPPISETQEEEAEVVARPAPEPVVVAPSIPMLSPTDVEAEPRPLLLGLEPPSSRRRRRFRTSSRRVRRGRCSRRSATAPRRGPSHSGCRPRRTIGGRRSSSARSWGRRSRCAGSSRRPARLPTIRLGGRDPNYGTPATRAPSTASQRWDPNDASQLKNIIWNVVPMLGQKLL